MAPEHHVAIKYKLFVAIPPGQLALNVTVEVLLVDVRVVLLEEVPVIAGEAVGMPGP
jgi:hypothetical protein